MSASSIRDSQCFRIGLSQPMIHGCSDTGNQGSLSPRTSAFKDALIRNVTFIQTMASTRENLRDAFMSTSTFLSLDAQYFIECKH